MKIAASAETPDGVLGSAWLAASAGSWATALKATDRQVVVDLSHISFVDLSTWIVVVSLLERLLGDPKIDSVAVHLFGDTDPIPSREDFRRAMEASLGAGPEMSRRKAVYRLARFLKDAGTITALERADRSKRIQFPFIDFHEIERPVYKAADGDHTVVHGLTRVSSASECYRFVDSRDINIWRAAMSNRFESSPLFESEELWRVMCHELAVNIVDHSSATGFLSVRVVEHPLDSAGMLRPWCHTSFGSLPKALQPVMRNGFIEVCVSDAGTGIVATLEPAYRHRFNLSPEQPVTPGEVLEFAFDEFGTRKTDADSWATDVHALARVLHMVERYGGVLKVSSGGLSVKYEGLGEPFGRLPNHHGYRSTATTAWYEHIPGTHIQLLLPLHPRQAHDHSATRRPVLQRPLPNRFFAQPNKPKGHLVPLTTYFGRRDEAAGAEERLSFFTTCERLTRELMQRPRSEPVVFDFGDLAWNEAQAETFLVKLQNVLQYRPALLIEIDPKLARGITALEQQQRPLHGDGNSVFLESYSRIGMPVLGLDSDGRPFIFGLRDAACEAALERLIYGPASIRDLTSGGVSESKLRRVLSSASPLFEPADRNRWRCAWNEEALAVEAARSIERHFEAVATANQAWRGKAVMDQARDADVTHSVSPKYHLPWINEWRSDFLDMSRILARGRHADEIAQRLVYRLEHGLTRLGRSMGDVDALACTSAPALLLASALHRWWRQPRRPAVVDLGYYVLSNRLEDIPAVTAGGGALIIEDLIDSGDSSKRLVATLQKQNTSVLAILGFARFNSRLTAARATSIDFGWTTSDEMVGSVPTHVMLEIPRPPSCEALSSDEDDRYAFVIERRSLRPVRYPTLRREFAPGRDGDLERRNRYMELLDQSREGCLVAAGHYVYGPRHYAVAVDIRSALASEVGDRIAPWIADVCEGLSQRASAPWETARAQQFDGDVSVVLMPLHSQIHYLWPRVEHLLSLRNRRQPMWLLDATIFTGRGPEYLIPSQLQHQLQSALQSASGGGLRILVIDDAAASGRTAETVLATILRLSNLVKTRSRSKHSPVQWIRYFVVLNQMDYPQNLLWSTLDRVGDDSIPFMFNSFAPFMGMAVYDAGTCPSCQTVTRLRRLERSAASNLADDAQHWIARTLKTLEPRAIDAPGFRPPRTRFSRPLTVLASRSGAGRPPSQYHAHHADTAIWRFLELMYLAYPPADVLRQLAEAWPHTSNPPNHNDEAEFQRYRQAVLDWCIRHWPRVAADGSAHAVIAAIEKEFDENTGIAVRVFEPCATLIHEPEVRRLVERLIDRLATLEMDRQSTGLLPQEERGRRSATVFQALTLLFLQASPAEIGVSPDGSHSGLVAKLAEAAERVSATGSTFCRMLYLQITRPKRHADAKWALESLAETLFRGRDPKQPDLATHELLPELVRKVIAYAPRQENLLLLQGSVNLFVASLDDLSAYSAVGREALELASRARHWLRTAETDDQFRDPSLFALRDLCALDSQFCRELSDEFHQDVASICRTIEGYARENAPTLDFSAQYEPVADARTLAPFVHLKNCLTNVAVDPARSKSGEGHRSMLVVTRRRNVGDEWRLVFRVLTNFASFEETSEAFNDSTSGASDRHMLEKFGTRFGVFPGSPDEVEQSQGYTAVFELSVMVGFKGRTI